MIVGRSLVPLQENQHFDHENHHKLVANHLFATVTTHHSNYTFIVAICN